MHALSTGIAVAVAAGFHRPHTAAAAGSAHCPAMESAMYRSLILAGTVVLSAAACSSAPVAGIQPIDGVISGQCHTDMVLGAAGLAASPATVERARVDSDSLQVQTVRGGTRLPATPTSATSGGDRLTIEVGRGNAITALRCG